MQLPAGGAGVVGLRSHWGVRMSIEAPPWKDMTTIALAAFGEALGVVNTWNALSQRRVRLVVRPSYAIDPNGQRPTILSIAVTNFSSFRMMTKQGGVAMRGQRENGLVRCDQGPGQYMLWEIAR
jgi:hypothetical protein